MEKVVIASEPIISEKAIVPHGVLTLTELVTYQDRVKPTGTWRQSAFGHATLQLYFDDDATGPKRTPYVQWEGTSKFGLGFYKGPSLQKGKKSKKDKDKKEKKGNATIAIEYDSSPQAQVLDTVWNAITENIMADNMDPLVQLLSPSNPHVACIQRQLARASSGYNQKKVTVSCTPGKVELNRIGTTSVCMNEFPMDVEGDYTLITETPYLDASLRDGVITFGPVLHGRLLAETTLTIKKPIEVRCITTGNEAKLMDMIQKQSEKAKKERKKQEKTKKEYDTIDLSKKKKRKEVPAQEEEEEESDESSEDEEDVVEQRYPPSAYGGVLLTTIEGGKVVASKTITLPK